MKKNKLFMCLLLLVISIFTLNVKANADEEYEAQIGDTKYLTLDDAVTASTDGDTINLLKDATTENGFGLKGVTLTVDGSGHKITFVGKTIYLAQGSKAAILTFKNSTIDMTATVGTPTVSGEGYPWAAVVLNWNCQLNLENTTLTMDGISSSTSATAVYMHAGASMTLTNSNMTAENYAGNGFSTDDGNYDVTVTLNNSTMTLNKNRTGFNSNYVVNVNNESNLIVTNSRGHGSNGADYFVDNSTVLYDSNGSHGMSSRNVVITNYSNVTSNNNRYYGVYVNGSGEFLVDSTSSLTTNSNGYAGLRLLASSKSSVVKAGGKLFIDANRSDGLYNQRTTVFEEGSYVEIMLNHDNGKGGGIYNTGTLTLPSNAVIYNNHAEVAGDDIYSTGSITLGNVGDNWYLDGEPDCTDKINGWYDDSIDNRWEAHGATLDDDHIELVNGGTYSDVFAVKAAHDKIKGNVTVKYVDTLGNELAESITTTDIVGEAYKTSAKDIEGYKLIDVDGEEEGTYIDGTIYVTYVYDLYVGDVVAKYVDSEGNELAESVTTTDIVGEAYKTSAKDIYGYKLINIEGEEEGTYIDGTIYVIYVYKLYAGSVVAKYVDTEGNKLDESVVTTDIVGKKYQTTAKDIEGYKLISVEGEEVGEYIEGVIYVTYYYDKNIGTGDITPPQTGVAVDNISSVRPETIILYKKEENDEEKA